MEEEDNDNEAERPNRFGKSFEGVGAQKTASVGGDVTRSKLQLEGRKPV